MPDWVWHNRVCIDLNIWALGSGSHCSNLLVEWPWEYFIASLYFSVCIHEMAMMILIAKSLLNLKISNICHSVFYVAHSTTSSYFHPPPIFYLDILQVLLAQKVPTNGIVFLEISAFFVCYFPANLVMGMCQILYQAFSKEGDLRRLILRSSYLGHFITGKKKDQMTLIRKREYLVKCHYS